MLSSVTNKLWAIYDMICDMKNDDLIKESKIWSMTESAL